MALLDVDALVAVLRAAVGVEDARAVLALVRDHPGHRFLTDDVSLADPDVPRLLGHRQVTDAHLLVLARRQGTRLVTFDRALGTLAAGRGVELLGPTPCPAPRSGAGRHNATLGQRVRGGRWRRGPLRLAAAWHDRVLADDVVRHAFSHGFHPTTPSGWPPTGPRRWAGPAPSPTPSVTRRDPGGRREVMR